STFLFTPRMSVNCRRRNRTSCVRVSSRMSFLVAPAVSGTIDRFFVGTSRPLVVDQADRPDGAPPRAMNVGGPTGAVQGSPARSAMVPWARLHSGRTADSTFDADHPDD